MKQKLIRISIIAFIIGTILPLTAMEKPSSSQSLTQETFLGSLPGDLKKELVKYLVNNPAVAFWALQAQYIKYDNNIPFKEFKTESPNFTLNLQGTKFAIYTRDGSTDIYDINTNKLIYTLANEKFLLWNSQGIKFASESQSGDIKIWNTTTGKFISEIDTTKQTQRQVWDRKTKNYRYQTETDKYTPIAITWNPQGTEIAGPLIDETIKIWDSNTGTLTHTLNAHPDGNTRETSFGREVVWNPQGTQIAYISTDNMIRIWDTNTGILTHKLQGIRSNSPLAWNPQGTKIAGQALDNTINIWAIQTGKLITKLNGHIITESVYEGTYDSPEAEELLTGNATYGTATRTSEIYSIEWNPQGTKISSTDGITTNIWDDVSGNLIYTLDGDSTKWNHQGAMIATADNRNIIICDADTGKLICVLNFPRSNLMTQRTQIIWSPQDIQIIGRSHDTIRIWTLIDPRDINALTIDNLPTLIRAYDAWKDDRPFIISKEELASLPKDFQNAIKAAVPINYIEQ